MRVVFAGDSITASADCDGWVPGVETINVAVPGFTTADLASQLTSIIALAPNVLVLLIGTNDLGGLDRDPHAVAEDIAAIVAQLLGDLPATRIVLNSVMPRDPHWTPAIRLINARLAQMATHPHVTFVDTWSALSDADDAGLDPRFLLDDGFDVHINDLGYEVWRGILAPAITAGR